MNKPGTLKCPPCDFCSGTGNCWKLGQLNACAQCAINLDIMQKDGILRLTKTEQYGGPKPGKRRIELEK